MPLALQPSQREELEATWNVDADQTDLISIIVIIMLQGKGTGNMELSNGYRVA